MTDPEEEIQELDGKGDVFAGWGIMFGLGFIAGAVFIGLLAVAKGLLP